MAYELLPKINCWQRWVNFKSISQIKRPNLQVSKQKLKSK